MKNTLQMAVVINHTPSDNTVLSVLTAQPGAYLSVTCALSCYMWAFVKVSSAEGELRSRFLSQPKMNLVKEALAPIHCSLKELHPGSPCGYNVIRDDQWPRKRRERFVFSWKPPSEETLNQYNDISFTGLLYTCSNWAQSNCIDTKTTSASISTPHERLIGQ